MPVKSLKRVIFLLFCLLLMQGVRGQVTFYSENFGTSPTTTLIPSYTGWENLAPILYSGSADVRNTTQSSGYAGASALANVFFTNTNGKDLLISGINSSGYTSIQLSLGHFKNTTTGNNELLIEVSADGVSWQQLTYSRATGAGTASWILVTPTGVIPSTTNLRIHFTQQSTTTQFRIDDIKLQGIVNCPTTVASFNPTSGPVGTQVTITGSNFTGATNVLFNGTSASSFNVINDNTILAVVPIGATTGKVSVLNSCTGVSSSDFSVINTSCALSGSNLIISELCNPDVHNGKDRYIEIYNPTNAPINLAGWTVRAISNGGITASCIQWPLSGTINPGQALTCGNPNPDFGGPHSFSHVDWWATYPTNTNSNDCYYNWNGQQRDGASLYNGTTRVDGIFRADSDNDWYSKKTIVRNPNVCIPNDNSLYTDWTDDPTLVNHAGDPPSTPRSHTANCTGIKPSILTHPLSQSLCGSQNVTLSVSASGGITPYIYVWKVYTGSGTWQTVTNVPPYSGATTATLTITNVQATFNNYQYYCEVYNADNSCYQASNAAMLNVGSGPAIDQVNVTHPSCGNSDGQIEIIISGGTPPYYYSIDDGVTWLPAGGTASTSYTFTGLAAGTNYRIKVKDAGCEVSYTSNPVTLTNTGNPPVDPTSLSVNRNNFCEDDAGNITLTLNGGSGEQVQWFTGSCGGTLINTSAGNTYTFASPTVTTTYYARWATASCGTSNCQSVTVNVLPLPQNPSSLTVDRNNFCTDDAGNITLTLHGGSGEQVQWFVGNDCTGTPFTTTVFPQNTLTIASPDATTIYSARWTSTSCGNSVCASVTVTVDNPILADAGFPQSKCGTLTTNLAGNDPTPGTGNWSLVSGPGTALIASPSLFSSSVSVSTQGIYVFRWTITPPGGVCLPHSDDVVIEFSDAVSVIASSNTPVCTGNALNLFSSISGASYSWTGPGTFTSTDKDPVINNAQLSDAGDYTVVVTGIPGGCPSTSATTHVDVYESAVAPQLLASSVISLCSDDNGAIILTATGGSGNTLEWFDDFCGGNLIGTGNNLSLPSPLVTTTYYARWNSAFCGNSSCQSVTVVVSDPPSQAIAGTDKNVCGLITSMSAVAPTVGTGQWSQVSGPASVVFGNASSNTSSVTATVIGTYVLRWTVTNMAQCPPSVDDVTVIFGNSVSVVASCNGPVCIGNTIRLYSSIDGATYSWTGPGAFTSNVQNPEIPNAQIPNMGVYFVTVSDIPGGCPDAMDDVAVVVTPKPLTAAINNNVSGVEDICNNQTSPYTIDPPTPGSVYTWSLSGGGTILPTASSNLINVQWAVVGGPYVLSVQETTTEGCTGDPVTLLVTVNDLSSPLVSIAASQNPACTGSTVTFTATPQFGGLNPVCKWYVNGIGPVVTDFTFSYVPAPNDEVQCKLTSSSPCAVGNPASSNKIVMSVAGTVAAGITIASPVQSLCIGDGATVKAVLTNEGNAPDIKWYKNGLLVPGESDTVFNFIPANGDKVYAELISNSACAIPAQASSTELMFIVSNALPLTVSISQDAVLCYGLPVTIKASTINQGSTPIYEWSQNGIPVPGVSGNSITKTFAEGDKVTLKVSSSLSCSTGSPATSNEITVTMPTQVSVVSVDTVSADCGEQNGSIEINANGGTGSFVYSIQAIENWRSSNHFDSIAPNTSYYVKAKDQNGCIGDYGIVTISALPGPLVNAVGPALVCEGSSLDMQASSSTLGLTYEWTSPAGMLFNGDLMNLNPVQLSDTGIYVVKGSAPSGCWDTSQFKVIVKPKPMVDFALPSPVCLGVSYTLDAGAGFATYQWQDGSIGQTFSAASAGDYFVEVTDLDGCKGGDTLQIVPCGSFYFPNAFTPNGDWKNDYFVPVTGGLNPKGFRLTIFNSWGQILFESSDPTTGWDGSMAGGQAPLGIYTYVCTYSLPDPDNISVYMEPETKRGLVLLLR